MSDASVSPAVPDDTSDATPPTSPADAPDDARRVHAPADADLAAVLALAERARVADGHPPFNDQTRAVLSRGTQRWWGVTRATDSGEITGAAVLAPEGDADGPAVLELVVDPARRRAGLGGALAAAAEGAASASSAAVSAWAHGDLPGSADLAARHGLVPVRELRRMRLEGDALGALPDLGIPADVRVRAFEPGRDEDAWLSVNAAAFADHPEQGSLTRADLEDRMAQEWFDPAGLLLAEEAEGGRLLGFHWTKVERHTEGAAPAEGEVYVVGVSPAAQGRGLGRVLTLAGLHHMADLPVSAVDLYVDADNTPAVRLYQTLGFRLSAADVQYRPR